MNGRKPGSLSLRDWRTSRQNVQGAEALGKHCFPLLTHRQLLTQPPGLGEERTEVDKQGEGALGTARESAPWCMPSLYQREAEARMGRDLAKATPLAHGRAGLGARSPIFSPPNLTVKGVP